jgi:allophanate hydrolase
MNRAHNLSETVEAVYERLEGEPLNPVWISLVPREAAIKRARVIETHPEWPLAGMTFAVKDNFDVIGVETTAGCPAYGH